MGLFLVLIGVLGSRFGFYGEDIFVALNLIGEGH